MKIIFYFISIVWLLSGCSSFSQASTTTLSVEAVKYSLKHAGPKATLEKYFNCEKYEDSAYQSIATGSATWVSVAEIMLKYSDACYTEGIQDSLGHAMQIAPQNVLPLVNSKPTLAADYICLPFISNELPIKAQLDEIAKSKNAILHVRDKKLQAQKEYCLRFIETIESNFAPPQHSMPN